MKGIKAVSWLVNAPVSRRLRSSQGLAVSSAAPSVSKMPAPSRMILPQPCIQHRENDEHGREKDGFVACQIGEAKAYPAASEEPAITPFQRAQKQKRPRRKRITH